MSETLTQAQTVANDYSTALQEIAAEEAPKIYGEGGGMAADGSLATAIDPVTFAKLSDSAYADGTSSPQNLPQGWREADEDELRALGLDPSMFNDDGSGSNASLFVNEDGQYVLAFRGSDKEWNDWSDNLTGSMMVTRQQKQATELGARVRSALEANGIDHSQLHFTGHSLGGGLASMASISTGVPATTFNPAGLGANDINFAQQRRIDLYAETSSASDERARVNAYVSEDDILNDFQDNTRAPDAYGTRHNIDTAGSPEEAFRAAYEQALGKGNIHAPEEYQAAVAAGNAAALKHRLDAHGLEPLIEALENK